MQKIFIQTSMIRQNNTLIKNIITCVYPGRCMYVQMYYTCTYIYRATRTDFYPDLSILYSSIQFSVYIYYMYAFIYISGTRCRGICYSFFFFFSSVVFFSFLFFFFLLFFEIFMSPCEID